MLFDAPSSAEGAIYTNLQYIHFTAHCPRNPPHKLRPGLKFHFHFYYFLSIKSSTTFLG